VPPNQPRKPRGTPVGGQFDRTLGGGPAVPSLDMPRELDENFYHRQLLERVTRDINSAREPADYHCGCQGHKHSPSCPFGLSGHEHFPNDPRLFGALLAVNGEAPSFTKTVVTKNGTRISLRNENLNDEDMVIVRMGTMKADSIAEKTVSSYFSYHGLTSQNRGLLCVSTFRIASPIEIIGIFSAMDYNQLGLVEYGNIRDIVNAIPTSIIDRTMDKPKVLAQAVHHDLVIEAPAHLLPKDGDSLRPDSGERKILESFVTDKVQELASRFERYHKKEIKND